MRNKIVPSLWFDGTDGDVSKVIDYYKNIFGQAMEAGKIIDLGDTPSGKTSLCRLQIFGQAYLMMSTDQAHDKFNDALTFTLQCEDQAEIDKYWDYFTKDGQASMCGWCHDKYGLRWQIVPKNLEQLLDAPGGWEVLMKQKKIVISEYSK